MIFSKDSNVLLLNKSFCLFPKLYYLCSTMVKNEWKSQQVLANELGLETVQVIHNWVKRKDKRIESKFDKNTGLTLVRLVPIKKKKSIQA